MLRPRLHFFQLNVMMSIEQTWNSDACWSGISLHMPKDICPGACGTQKGQQSIEIDRVTFKFSGNMYISCPWLMPFLHSQRVSIYHLFSRRLSTKPVAGGCWWLINPSFLRPLQWWIPDCKTSQSQQNPNLGPQPGWIPHALQVAAILPFQRFGQGDAWQWLGMCTVWPARHLCIRGYDMLKS